MPYIKESRLIIDISLDMCIRLSDITTVHCLQCIRHICCLPTYAGLVSEWHPYTVINVLASNHAIEFVNNGTGTCILPWTCEH